MATASTQVSSTLANMLQTLQVSSPTSVAAVLAALSESNAHYYDVCSLLFELAQAMAQGGHTVVPGPVGEEVVGGEEAEEAEAEEAEAEEEAAGEVGIVAAVTATVAVAAAAVPARAPTITDALAVAVPVAVTAAVPSLTTMMTQLRQQLDLESSAQLPQVENAAAGLGFTPDPSRNLGQRIRALWQALVL